MILTALNSIYQKLCKQEPISDEQRIENIIRDFSNPKKGIYLTDFVFVGQVLLNNSPEIPIVSQIENSKYYRELMETARYLCNIIKGKKYIGLSLGRRIYMNIQILKDPETINKPIDPEFYHSFRGNDANGKRVYYFDELMKALQTHEILMETTPINYKSDLSIFDLNNIPVTFDLNS